MRSEWKVIWEELGMSVYGSMVFLVVIRILLLIMKDRKSYRMEFSLKLHNLASFLMALYMFTGITSAMMLFHRNYYLENRELYESIFDFYKDMFHNVLCDPDGSIYNMYFSKWCYYFYLSKYFEYLDTAILVLRKRPIADHYGLHVIHHATYIINCAGCHYSGLCSQFFFAWMNTGVHSVMYFYYFLTSLKLSTKMNHILKVVIARRITRMQVTQFIVGTFIGLYALVYQAYNPDTVCTGRPFHYLFGMGLTTLFFIQFTIMSTRRYISTKTE